MRGWAGSECVEELGPGRRGRRPPGDRAVLGGAGRAGRRAGAALAGAPARPAGRSAMPAGGGRGRPVPAGVPRPATGHPGASARWSRPGRVGLLGLGAPLDDHPGGRRGAPTAGAIAAAPPGESAAARPGQRGRRPGPAAGSSAARCTGVQLRDPAAHKATRQRSVSGKARAKTAQDAVPHRPCRAAAVLRTDPSRCHPPSDPGPAGRPGRAGRKPGVTLLADAGVSGASACRSSVQAGEDRCRDGRPTSWAGPPWSCGSGGV